MERPKEDKSGWSSFLNHLVNRGLSVLQLVISDACRGLAESAAEFLPDAQRQRCVVHFYRNAAAEKMQAVIADLRTMSLPRAAELLRRERA